MSNPPSHIYRYDHILGLVENELSGDLYRRWGTALAEMSPPSSSIIVTSDTRKNSDRFKEALVDGLISRGIHVIDFGTVPYDLASYGNESLGADGFVGIGGGARPSSWNGLRWRLRHSPLSYPEQVKKLHAMAERPDPSPAPSKEKERGKIRSFDIAREWISWLQTVWYDAPRVSFRIIVDPLYGNWSRLARQTLQAVYPQMIFEAVHDEPKEDFDGLIPSSRHQKSISTLCREVDIRRADFGFALDADAGHFTVVDGQGVPMLPEEIAWFVLHDLLGPALDGEIFLHDTQCSELVIAEGKRHGGKPFVVSRLENAFLDGMKQTNAIIGLGSDGEIYFRGAQGNRIVVFALCWFLDYLSRIRIPLAEWRAMIPPFYTTPEFRTPQASLDEVTRRLARFWNSEPMQTIDGLRFTDSFGRVDVRTIPDYAQLGFHFEASDRRSLQQIVMDCSAAMEDLDHIGLFLGEQYQALLAGKFY